MDAAPAPTDTLKLMSSSMVCPAVVAQTVPKSTPISVGRNGATALAPTVPEGPSPSTVIWPAPIGAAPPELGSLRSWKLKKVSLPTVQPVTPNASYDANVPGVHGAAAN